MSVPLLMVCLRLGYIRPFASHNGGGQDRNQGGCRGWFGQGRLSGERHTAGQLKNALSRKLVLRFFVVLANTGQALLGDGKLAPNGEREPTTVLVCPLAGNVGIETISDLE